VLVSTMGLGYPRYQAKPSALDLPRQGPGLAHAIMLCPGVGCFALALGSVLTAWQVFVCLKLTKSPGLRRLQDHASMGHILAKMPDPTILTALT
jgi:hypothetical protein